MKKFTKKISELLASEADKIAACTGTSSAQFTFEGEMSWPDELIDLPTEEEKWLPLDELRKLTTEEENTIMMGEMWPWE